MNNKMFLVLVAALPLIAGCWSKKEKAPEVTQQTEEMAPVAHEADHNEEAEHSDEDAEHNEDEK
jgi:hypothetical protein